MPYEIKPVSDGFKVCKQSDMKECYSKRGLPYKRALAQMRAIYASESGRPNPQLKRGSKKGSRKGSRKGSKKGGAKKKTTKKAKKTSRK
jgi:hypothetical protein